MGLSISAFLVGICVGFGIGWWAKVSDYRKEQRLKAEIREELSREKKSGDQ